MALASAEQRDACTTMGCAFVSTDHLIVQALEWLSYRCQEFRVRFIEKSWVIEGTASGSKFVAGDDILWSAMCAAVFSVDAIEKD